MEKGNSNAEAIIILAVLVAIAIISPGNFFRQPGDIAPSGDNGSSPAGGSGGSTGETSSSYSRDISIGNGNAAYAYQSYEEYITLDNRGRDSINITGWQLQNDKDNRAYDLGGAVRHFSADVAIIPQAARLVSPTGNNVFQNVILEPGERAIVTTGSVGPQLPYKIVSFKENICSGYLENLSEYTFTPSLSRNCPRPANEPGVNALDTECRKFIERMSSCRTPEFETLDRNGDVCKNCVDGVPLSSSCVAFIKSRFSYSSCIANHSGDPDFSEKTWRIFLGRGWEMWAREYETIKLFDQLGRLVNTRSY